MNTEELHTKAVQAYEAISPRPSLRAVATAMGNTSHEWVRMFIAGQNKDTASYSRIVSLLNALDKLKNDTN